MRTDVGDNYYLIINVMLDTECLTVMPGKFFRGIIQGDSLDEYKKWKN